MSDQPSMPVALLNWKAMQRNSLRGFASVRVGRSLVIEDCPVHASNGRRWASLPSKPLVDRDGNVQRDQAGKMKYVPLVRWVDRESGPFLRSGYRCRRTGAPGSDRS